ncbi:Outer membrane protein (porin) [Collimonas sp. OK307]|uniref:porin n=1 Tax=Collimonas sp. OK307 TaxID=1801620 RepID=UPI0008EB2C0A|nr:porin [Collimonas sp. OK307]SFH72091.1 Outer membrane protein (porin) [Collimonas sp. OK307]
MKKSALLFAVLGGGSAQIALAQSSTTIYGVADMGFVFENGSAAGSVTKLTSGVGYGSRLGFKGIEDLGGGMSAKYVLEAGILMDTGASAQGGILFGRQSYVGLSGAPGSVTLGRQYTPYYWTLFTLVDPFGTGYAGTATNLMANPGRANNMVLYTTPTIGGVTGELSYSVGEVAGNITASRATGGSLGYVNGPFVIKLTFNNAANATGTDNAKNVLLGGTYNFGPVKLHAAYAQNKGLGTTNTQDGLIGVTVPIGANRILASYVVKNDRSIANRDAHQFGLGYVYSVSKRTELYTAYAHISNKNGATYTVGNGTELGSGNSAFNLGMRHFF